MLPIILVIRSLIPSWPHSFIHSLTLHSWLHIYTLIVATLYTREWIYYCVRYADQNNTEHSAMQAVKGLEMMGLQMALWPVQAISTSEHLLWLLKDRQTFCIINLSDT